jgi:hypothetical protein
MKNRHHNTQAKSKKCRTESATYFTFTLSLDGARQWNGYFPPCSVMEGLDAASASEETIVKS